MTGYAGGDVRVTNCYTGGRVPPYHLAVKFLALFLALLLAGGSAWPQQGRRHEGKQQRQMREEERQRLRDDMREVYRERGERPERPRQMTDAEREKLRRDIDETNRQMRRK